MLHDKRGFTRWGLKRIGGNLKEKGLSPQFSVRALRKRARKAEKGRTRLISRKGGQRPLKPPFVTPPFARAQLEPKTKTMVLVLAMGRVKGILPEHQIRLFLEISYFKLEISCLQNEPKSLFFEPNKTSISRTKHRLN